MGLKMSNVPKAYRRLLAAADYLIANYLLDEKEDRNLCHGDDHWAAINLVADAVDDCKALGEQRLPAARHDGD